MAWAVTSGAADTVLSEARRAGARECCGLLLGKADRIEQAVPTANLAADPVRAFEIDPAALIAAHRAARTGGPELIGYYHSHPSGPAQPSACDQAGAARDGKLWVIAAGGKLRLWQDAAAGFVELPYIVTDG